MSLLIKRYIKNHEITFYVILQNPLEKFKLLKSGFNLV